MAKVKTEKGSGGKRGQSGKDNWQTHQEEKQLGRTNRRLNDRMEEREALTKVHPPEAAADESEK